MLVRNTALIGIWKGHVLPNVIHNLLIVINQR